MAKMPTHTLILSTIFLLTVATTHGKESESNIEPKNAFHRVSFSTAGDLLFYPEKKATALVKPINHAMVPAQISAQVKSVHVLTGERVKLGQVLLTLDCKDKKNLLARQESQYVLNQAKLKFAERNYERGLQLKKNKNIGEADLDAKKIEATIAKETLAHVNLDRESARLSVSRCQISSPFEGVVTKRMISEGDYVNVGQSLVQVLQLNNLEIEAQIPIDQIKDLRSATKHYFIKGEYKTLLKLNNIVEFITQNSQSKVVTFSVPRHSSQTNKGNKPNKKTNENLTLVAGLNGMVSWQSEQGFLPAHLLTQRNGMYGIFTIVTRQNEHIAKFIPLPQAQEGRPFALDIPNNVKVVIDGRHRVNDNDIIRISSSGETRIKTHGQRD